MEPNRRPRSKVQSPHIPFYAMPHDKQSSSEIIKEARKNVRGGEPKKSKGRSTVRGTPTPEHHSSSFDFVLSGAGLGFKSSNLEKLPPVGKSTTPHAVGSVVSTPMEVVSLEDMLHRHIQAMKSKLEMKSNGDGCEQPELQQANDKSTSLSDRYRRIREGDIEGDIPNVAKVVRVFMSSTFTDTKEERNALMYHAVPKLKRFCQEMGYEFQIVDMRWGIPDDAANDHMTAQLCLQEVRNCQMISTGPNFVTLLSHKYGYRSLPAAIDGGEYAVLYSGIHDEQEKALFDRWYKKDDNAVPPSYMLQPISSIIPNFGHRSIRMLAEKAKAEWGQVYQRMSSILTKTALYSFGDHITAHKFISSLTEKEIEVGLLRANDASSSCAWFKRHVTGLQANDRGSTARQFIDQLDDKGTPNQMSQDLLSLLKSYTIPSVLPKENIAEYSVPWKRGKIDPSKHSKSVENLCENFQSRLEEMIRRGIAEKEQMNDGLYEEVIQHARFCQQKCEVFHGRHDTLKRIEEYVVGKDNQPLVVYGQSGCGKTSIVAMAARNVNKWLQGRCKVVLRFVGTTPDSTIIHRLLTSICDQIVTSYNSSLSIPQGLRELREFLPKCLNLATNQEKLVILLDSLDQMETQDGARQLAWLPKYLPENVKMVVSTLPEEEYTCFPMLQAKIRDVSLFVPVPQLQKGEVYDILQTWLKSAQRTLTTPQMNVLIGAFHQCPLPLYLKLSFDEACRWRSYTPGAETTLDSTVRGVINSLFERVEKERGTLLVQRALGYLTAAKSGLSESEIEDILSCDDDVLNDVYQYWTPPTRRLPPLLWVRIRSHLSQYLTERGADGSRVINWYHRQFIEAAKHRYLGDAEQRKIIHGGLADFFMGKWANGSKKGYVSKQGQKGEADRHVADQPLSFGKAAYNLRKLNELPVHLVNCMDLESLKKDILCNFDWLVTKIQATKLRDVMDDFKLATSTFPGDIDIRTIKETLQLSEEGILLSPYQLPGQLLGRLTKDTYHLLDVAAIGNVPACLLPSHVCMTKPGGPMVHTMTGHVEKISSLKISKDGKYVITGSYDQSVKIWFLNDGLMLRSIDEIGESIDDIQLLDDERYIAVVHADGTNIYRFQNGELVQTIEKTSSQDRSRPMNIFSVGSRLFIVGFGYVKMVDLSDSFEPYVIEGEVAAELGNAPTVYSETLYAVADNLVAFKDPTHKSFTIADTTNRLSLVRRCRIFKADDEEGIRLLTSTYRGDILFATKPSNKLMMYDIRNDKVLHNTFLENINQDVQFYNRLCTSLVGPYFLGIGTFKCVLWNMETGVHRQIYPELKVRSVVTTQGKQLVSCCYDDHNLRVWDTTRQETSKNSEADGKLGEEEEEFRQLHPLQNKTFNQFTTISRKEGKGVIFSLWKLHNGRAKRHHSVQHIPFHKSGNNLLQCLDDEKAFSRTGDQEEKALSIVNIKTWEIMHSCGEGNMSQYLDCHVVNSGKEILAGSPFQQNVMLLSTEDGQVVASLTPQTNENCYRIKTDLKGNVAILHFHSSGLQVWSISERRVIFGITSTSGKTTDISFDLSPDGGLLMLKSDCSIAFAECCTDIKKNSVLKVADKGSVQCTLSEDEMFKGFIGDGQSLVTAKGGVWTSWSSESGEQLKSWRMPQKLMDGEIVDSRLDGNILVCSKEHVKKTVGILDADQGKMVASFTFDGRIRTCVLLSGGRVIAAIIDGELVVLRLVGSEVLPFNEAEDLEVQRAVTA
ncbi:NACHT and WD repeat domain-containing protein 2-like [Glandiceps talaboti]